MPQFANTPIKGGKGKAKRQKTSQSTQREWAYIQEPATSLVSPGPFQAPYTPNSKGKGPKGKPKGKSKFSPSPTPGKGKGKPQGKGKGKPKGKGKGKPAYQGTSTPGITPFQSSTSDNKGGPLTKPLST